MTTCIYLSYLAAVGGAAPASVPARKNESVSGVLFTMRHARFNGWSSLIDIIVNALKLTRCLFVPAAFCFFRDFPCRLSHGWPLCPAKIESPT